MSLIKSWVATANSATTDFPLNNLPYGVFSLRGDEPRCGVAIGEMVLDMGAPEVAGLVGFDDGSIFDLPYWNDFMELGPSAWAALRERLIALLKEGSADKQSVEPHLIPMNEVALHMPFAVSEFTDFYAGKHHATNVGTMFRGPENALPANWLSIPIGYNGRASTVVVSGTPVVRPSGQLKSPDHDLPHFGASQRLDIELELGAIVGTSSEMGQRVSVSEADEMIFGYVLLNDWSARDIQAWEYQPLGPFQSKAFASSISPWIVTRHALEPFRVSSPERERPLLPYLQEPGPMLYDISLEVALQPKTADRPSVIAETNARELYYSAAQQLAHHSSSGCAMNTGDLLGSGTISGAEKMSRGSLLELTWGGEDPIELPNGETRTFLEDGDTVTLSGRSEGNGFHIGFGTCNGKVLAAN